jgi:hypothetical protein
MSSARSVEFLATEREMTRSKRGLPECSLSNRLPPLNIINSSSRLMTTFSESLNSQSHVWSLKRSFKSCLACPEFWRFLLEVYYVPAHRGYVTPNQLHLLRRSAFVAERLRRETRNLLGSPRAGSNPAECARILWEQKSIFVWDGYRKLQPTTDVECANLF